MPKDESKSDMANYLDFMEQMAANTKSIQKGHEKMVQLMNKMSKTLTDEKNDIEFVMESLSNSITSEFIYDPENNITFENWFARFSDTFKHDATRLNDKQKVRILMRKLGTREHDLFTHYFPASELSESNFDQIVEKLKFRFGSKETVFRSRYKCFHIAKRADEDFLTLAGRINNLVGKIDYSKMTEEQFKCLLFVFALQSPADKKLREKILDKLDMQKFTNQQGESTVNPLFSTLNQIALHHPRHRIMANTQIPKRRKSLNAKVIHHLEHAGIVARCISSNFAATKTKCVQLAKLKGTKTVTAENHLHVASQRRTRTLSFKSTL